MGSILNAAEALECRTLTGRRKLRGHRRREGQAVEPSGALETSLSVSPLELPGSPAYNSLPKT